MGDESWTVRIEGSEAVLLRTLECQICCKRRRDRCHICGGTGIRTAEYRITVEAAAELYRSLSLALPAARSGT
jgi:hypothetical protein